MAEDLFGQASRPFRLARDQGHGGGVDAGKIAAGAAVNDFVALGCLGRRLGPGLGWRQQRRILGQARRQRRDVFLVSLCQAVFVVTLGGQLGRPGAGQHQHGTITQPEIVGVVLQALAGYVVGAQELAAAFQLAGSRQPFSGRRRGIKLFWTCLRHRCSSRQQFGRSARPAATCSSFGNRYQNGNKL